MNIKCKIELSNARKIINKSLKLVIYTIIYEIKVKTDDIEKHMK